MPNGRFERRGPTPFEVHLGNGQMAFVCYLVPGSVKGRVPRRSPELFLQDFLWLEAVGCALCSWLCHKAEGSTRSPMWQLPCQHQGGAGCEVPWTRRWGPVSAASTRKEAAWPWEWKELGRTSERFTLECRFFGSLQVWPWPKVFSFIKQQLATKRFILKLMAENQWDPTCRVSQFLVCLPNSETSLSILKKAGWLLQTSSASCTQRSFG